MREFNFIEFDPQAGFGSEGRVSDVGTSFTVPSGAYANEGTVVEDGGDDGIIEDRSEADPDLDAQGEIILSDGTVISDAEFEIENTWTLEWETADGIQTTTIAEFQFQSDSGGGQTSGLISGGGLPPEGVTVKVIGFNANPDQNAEGIEFTQISTDVLCFAHGTMIETDRGAAAIEDLTEGDLVVTLDHGLQPVRWIGRRRVSGRGRFAPIRIDAGVFGNATALEVSPCHRLLLRGWRAEALFGSAEVLAPARNLLQHEGVNVVLCPQVEYFHLLFDRHQIVRANGVLAESLHPTQEAVGAMSAAAQAELLALMPELDTSAPARVVVAAPEAAALM